jgi:hypothetical protein
MSRSNYRLTALAVLAASALSACAVTGVGVEGDVGYAGGYYEPYGYDYGGWGGTYFVGPGRGRGFDHRDDHHDEHHEGHAPRYRPAPAGRSAPSLPRRSRGR